MAFTGPGGETSLCACDYAERTKLGVHQSPSDVTFVAVPRTSSVAVG